MATVELIPPPEPEKQVVIRLTKQEAKILLDSLGRYMYSGTIHSIADGLTRVID